MALSAAEQRRLRNGVERIANSKGVPVTWTKDEIHAAVGAIEDRWDAPATQAALSNDIEAAAPGVFTNAQKRYLAAIWLVLRGERERSNL